MSVVDLQHEAVIPLAPSSPSTDPSTGPRTDPEALWNAHFPVLTGWCAALVGDVDVAGDIAAEAFSRLVLRWRTVEEPKAYLFAVAGNLVRDHWRRQARDRGLLRRLSRTTAVAGAQTTPAADPWLRDLVERLPDRTREPVLLHYFADLPVSSVAAVLGKNESTVKNALVDGRAALLRALQESDRD